MYQFICIDDENIFQTDGPAPLLFEVKDNDEKPSQDEPAITRCQHTRASKRSLLKFGRKSRSVVICEDANCPNYHEPPTRKKKEGKDTAKGCVIQ